MTSPGSRLTPEQIHTELKGLRHGHSLAHPGVVRSLSTELQELLLTSQGSLTGQADDVPRIIAALRRAIDALGQHERLHAQVEFNLLGEHSHPTLGARQESLAALLGCTAKTVRRSSARALDTLAMLIATGTYPPPPNRTTMTAADTDQRVLACRPHPLLGHPRDLAGRHRVLRATTRATLTSGPSQRSALHALRPIRRP